MTHGFETNKPFMDEQYAWLEVLVARASVGTIDIKCEGDRKSYIGAANAWRK